MELELKLKNEEDMFEFKSIINKGKIEYIDARKILNIIKPEIKKSIIAKKKKSINYSAIDIRPIEIGMIKKDLTINEKNIKDKYVILNGESLLKERLDTGFVKIKAHIKEFENWEDMKKRALSFDIRETYTKEELNIKIRAIIREKIRLNEKFTSQELSLKTGVSRSVISKINTFYRIEKEIHEKEHIEALHMTSNWCYVRFNELLVQGPEMIRLFFEKYSKKIIKDGGINRGNDNEYKLLIKAFATKQNEKEAILQDAIKELKRQIDFIKDGNEKEIKKELKKIISELKVKNKNTEEEMNVSFG